MLPTQMRQSAWTTRLACLTLLVTSVLAIGDFPCDGDAPSQTCAEWSVNDKAQGTISATAVCMPDPINPSVSYCGYASAPCTQDIDCDYGACGKEGFCTGYLGDPCPRGDKDCQAFFFCGTDGTCGGVGAGCANGQADSPIPEPNQQCTSNVCHKANQTCAALPDDGMPLGSGCAAHSVCASGYCAPSNLCMVPLGAKQIEIDIKIVKGEL
ncbi:hypothetical protein OIV83_002405 [Microbotryomycetes sp. JL201]|nr:hypothetical protein OIV83_002405 [Microbotryomycetes sp. JL201]